MDKFGADSAEYINLVYCPYCGKSISENSNFCENCDRDLSDIARKDDNDKSILLNYGEVAQKILNFKEDNFQRHREEKSFLINIIKTFKITISPREDSLDEKTIDELDILRKKIDAIKSLEIFLERGNNRIKEIKNNVEEDDGYLIYSKKIKITEEIQELQKSFDLIYSSNFLPIDTRNNAENSIKISQNVLSEIDSFNNNFIERQKKEHSELFKSSGIELDDDQKRAVITDDKYNLVVAGAGSGKTEVLISRIAYLTQREKDRIKPERILALAFQAKAKEEIKERLDKRYGVDIEIRTFHSLGNKILDDYANETGSKRPNLIDELTRYGGHEKYIQKIFNTEIVNKENNHLREDIINFMKRYGDNEVIRKEEGLSRAEFFKYQRSLRYTTLDGTSVKSESERKIMNFFLTHKLNGEHINIVYESPADWMEYTNTMGHLITPKPDFYFPVFDLYLEHWAINSRGKVPDWFEGKNPTEIYIENMNKKKEKFIENNKILIETSEADFEKEFIDNILKERFLNALKKVNPEINYKIEPLSYNEIIGKVWGECREFVKYLPRNISKFIRIAKTYNLSALDIERKLDSSKWSPRQIYFARIALKIFEKYQESLGENIDFEDMINDAIKYLKENESFYQNTYDHILVDEYQDISTQRYKLINQIMKKNPNAKLFCVGDDWQSIMGFAGSNVDLFINFGEYFGNHARTDLGKNYRSIKSIVDTGASIIKNNKNYLEKKTTSNSDVIKPIIVYLISHSKKYRNNYYKQMAWHCLNEIKEIKKKENIPYSDFMILLRIRRVYKLRNALNKYAEKLDIPITEVGIGNCVRVMTVHKSKGLQSKYVFILNVDKDMYGFPCEIEDSNILEPAKDNNNHMRKEEERRLFYVALTRAKEGVFIYTQKCVESQFISELKDLEYVKRVELPYEVL
ncbi:MAG: UvrD-helicase domain-containing protein [Candidatus Methanofastidiosa archaeon]|nr:UvrD-helicase domain-containing protein [Candidatus Methanofastidiosa archaeon]